jgi:hypothetical protein
LLIAATYGVALVSIIAVGSATGHRTLGIFVAVGLVLLIQFVAIVLTVRRSRRRPDAVSRRAP